MKLEIRPELRDHVRFIQNKKYPRHRWFFYKEAFSRDLVSILLEKLRTTEKVLDPFSGSGTTSLTCREHDLNSIGIDVNPIALTASIAKTKDYDLDDLKKERRRILSERYTGAKGWEEMKTYFDKETLGRLLFYRSLASDSENREFFLLALANAAYECSRVVRDGAVLRKTKKPFMPLKAAFERNLKSMERDIKKTELGGSAKILEADARNIPLKTNTIDTIITSPPYLGIDDYTKSYTIENFVVGGKIKKWLGQRGDEEDYASDMEKVLKEMKRVSKKDANIAIVIWDGFINKKIIDILELVQGCADKAKLNAESAWLVRNRPALVDRTKRIGLLKEVVIFLKN